MTIRDQILALRLQNPFAPFRIKTASGTCFDLTESLMFAVGQTIVLIAHEAGGHIRVKMQDIVSIDALEPIA